MLKKLLKIVFALILISILVLISISIRKYFLRIERELIFIAEKLENIESNTADCGYMLDNISNSVDSMQYDVSDIKDEILY